jgi:hypothetical protein
MNMKSLFNVIVLSLLVACGKSVNLLKDAASREKLNAALSNIQKDTYASTNVAEDSYGGHKSNYFNTPTYGKERKIEKQGVLFLYRGITKAPKYDFSLPTVVMSTSVEDLSGRDRTIPVASWLYLTSINADGTVSFNNFEKPQRSKWGSGWLLMSVYPQKDRVGFMEFLGGSEISLSNGKIDGPLYDQVKREISKNMDWLAAAAK